MALLCRMNAGVPKFEGVLGGGLVAGQGEEDSRAGSSSCFRASRASTAGRRLAHDTGVVADRHSNQCSNSNSHAPQRGHHQGLGEDPDAFTTSIRSIYKHTNVKTLTLTSSS